MKRSTVLVVVMLSVLVLVAAGLYMLGPSAVGTAGAADFSGKWINYKMFAEEGGEVMEVNFETELGDSFVEDEVGYVEFKDEKAYVRMTGDDEVKELEYKAANGKLIVEISDEMKAEGLTSIEFSFEGNDLVWTVSMEGGNLKNYYRMPK